MLGGRQEKLALIERAGCTIPLQATWATRASRHGRRESVERSTGVAGLAEEWLKHPNLRRAGVRGARVSVTKRARNR
jgi:hypothetical protein